MLYSLYYIDVCSLGFETEPASLAKMPSKKNSHIHTHILNRHWSLVFKAERNVISASIGSLDVKNKCWENTTLPSYLLYVSLSVSLSKYPSVCLSTSQSDVSYTAHTPQKQELTHRLSHTHVGDSGYARN